MAWGFPGVPDLLAILLLWAGFAYAAWTDWRTREVGDGVWLVMMVGGVLVGLARVLPNAGADVSWVALDWVLVSALALEHLLPWDVPLAKRWEWLPGAIELVAYGVVGAAVVGTILEVGVGAGELIALAAYLGIVLARTLFELRLLYGGADAKALMAAGLLLPLWASPWVPLPPSAVSILNAYPFALTLLMNGALLSAAIPLGLAALNLRRGEFEFPRGFTGFRIPVETLPDRYVWVRDPTFHREDDDVESSEDDRKLRLRQRDELRAKGVRRIWVTPQLPFVILLALGAVTGVVFGNLVFDLLAIL